MKLSFSALRKFAALPFVAGILVGVAGTATGATVLGSTVFSDVQPGSYYDAAVGRLAAQGIVRGFNGKYRPGDFVNRAEVAVMIDRAINGEAEGSTSSRPPRSSSSSSAASVSSAPVVTAAGKVHFTTTGFNVGQDSKRATITVVRTGGKTGLVKVDYAFGGGTAVSGTDYVPSSGTLSFADGETTKNISVTLTRPSIPPQQTLNVTLSNVTGGAAFGSPITATLTLLGTATTAGSSSSASSTSAAAAAGSLSFSANTYAADENTGAITITVRRTGGTTNAVTVNYATSNGSAAAGINYSATQGTLSFASGETSKTFSVQLTDNAAIEGNKTVNLTLSTPTGGANIVSPGSAVLTVVDNEASPSSATGSVQFSSDTYNVLEGDGKVTVTVLRQLGNAGTVNVNYATSDGSATGAADYTGTSGTITFLPGETSKSFTVTILKDTLVEATETVNLTLSGINGPATLGSISTSTIRIQ